MISPAPTNCWRTCKPIRSSPIKAYDADARVLEPLAAAGKTAVIPPTASRSRRRGFDRELFKSRHLIENFFARLKLYRAIATRYDKTKRNFLAAIHLVAAVIWLN